MIEALTQIGHQFFFGEWFESLHSTEGRKFQYELLDEPRKTYGQMINNLITSEGRKTIKTNWSFDWKPRQVVVDNYGERWKIQEVVTLPQEVNSQVAHWAINPDVDYVLSLVRIANPKEVGVL